MEGGRVYPTSQEMEKNPYVDCNFNWTNIDLSPDPESVYQEVVDISHSDIYQFDVSGKSSTKEAWWCSG